jgi:hypothetical protein
MATVSEPTLQVTLSLREATALRRLLGGINGETEVRLDPEGLTTDLYSKLIDLLED